MIVTLPPRLALRLIFEPELPKDVAQAMKRTPTWMGNAMKVVVGYDSAPSSVPFWRQKKLAGYAISDGPCQQIHDHCSGEGQSMLRHALFGWVDEDDAVKTMEKEQRREHVLQQLARIFGEEAKEKVLFYSEHVGALKLSKRSQRDLIESLRIGKETPLRGIRRSRRTA